MNTSHNKSILVLLSLTLFVAVMIMAKGIIRPFALALLLCYLIVSFSRVFEMTRHVGFHTPRWIRSIISFLVIGLLLASLAGLLRSNIISLSLNMSTYTDNVSSLLESVTTSWDPSLALWVKNALVSIRFDTILAKSAGALTGTAGRSLLVLVYTIFLLIEYPVIRKKLSLLFPDKDHQKRIHSALSRVGTEINTYFQVKTLASILTGVLGYAVLVLFHVDFALFWAVFIFVLNFIPTIGSIIGVIFPSLLALAQYASFGPFLWVAVLLIITQFLVGNILEPRFAGGKLNLSPLVITLSLVVGGVLWGTTGLLIATPALIILKHALSSFSETKHLVHLLEHRPTNTTQ